MNNNYRSEATLVMCTLIASAGWIFSKNALAEFGPYTFLAIRFLIASLTLACLCHRPLLALTLAQFARAVLTGLTLGLTLLFWVLALQRTDHVGEGAFIVSLSVIVTPVLGRLFFSEKITLRMCLSILPALLGLAALTLSGDGGIESTQSLFLLSTIGFALHLLFTSHFAPNIPSLPLTCIQLAIVGLVACAAALISEPWEINVSQEAWGWLICSALVATSLRFSLQIRAMQNVSASNTSMIFTLEPVWTALLGAALLAERMSMNQLLGCSLILGALVIHRWALITQTWTQIRKYRTENQ